MDINSIDNSLASLNNASSQHKVSKKQDTSSIYNESEGSFSLIIKDYNKKRDELSDSLKVFNEGIAMSKIALNGLEKEQTSLKNIENIIISNNEYNDKNQIKNNISEELKNFRNDAFQTQYKREKLIALDDLEQNLNIEISTKEAYYSIEKPNTPLIASSISQNIKNSDLNNQEDLETLITSVEKGLSTIKSIKSQFEELNQNLVSSAKGSILDQIELSKQNKNIARINFQQESSSFSKDNINSNSGFLVGSQANIVQEQSITLLT